MSDSHAGITVPEGEPDGLRAAAGRFHGLSGSLQGAEAELNSLPAAMGSWSGPASVLYANSCMPSRRRAPAPTRPATRSP